MKELKIKTLGVFMLVGTILLSPLLQIMLWTIRSVYLSLIFSAFVATLTMGLRPISADNLYLLFAGINMTTAFIWAARYLETNLEYAHLTEKQIDKEIIEYTDLSFKALAYSEKEKRKREQESYLEWLNEVPDLEDVESLREDRK